MDDEAWKIVGGTGPPYQISNEHHCTESFDCGECDLNDFFRKDAFNHKKELLAETYYLEPKEATEQKLFFPVAFVSFVNDSIELDKDERKSIIGKYIKKTIPYPKYN